MKITYERVDSFEGWGRARPAITSLIDQLGSHSVLEIGAGANPTLAPGDINALAIEYTVNDHSESEINKGRSHFPSLIFDFCENDLPPHLHERFDLIFSRMVHEHVRDGAQFNRNVCHALRRGGVCVHWFSTLYSIPFAANRILAAPISNGILRVVNPRDTHLHGKFSAYYSWCRGPSRRMINRYDRLGLKILEYTGYFGHGYYGRFPVLQRLEDLKSSWLVRHPAPILTSYAKVVLQKTEDPAALIDLPRSRERF